MTDLAAWIAVLVGIAARLAIPILVTAAAVYFLRRLDARWQREARSAPVEVRKPACWEVQACPAERSHDCPGRLSPLPCWQARRSANGYLREQCLTCIVFLKAPAPQMIA